LRIGEMERDSILAHGMSGFLNESMMERSDGHMVSIDNSDGLLSETDRAPHQTNVQMPYSFKLLMQELQTMSLGLRVITENNKPPNPAVFNYLTEHT
jgi:DNA-directed RNA polymerase beta subunit